MMKATKSIIGPILILLTTLLALQACGRYDFNEALLHNAVIRDDLTKTVKSHIASKTVIREDIDWACVISPFANLEAIARYIGDERLAQSRIWIPIGDESWTLAYRLRSGKWDFVVFPDDPASLVLDRSRYQYDNDACVRAPAYIEVVRDANISSGVTKIVITNKHGGEHDKSNL